MTSEKTILETIASLASLSQKARWEKIMAAHKLLAAEFGEYESDQLTREDLVNVAKLTEAEADTALFLIADHNITEDFTAVDSAIYAASRR